MLKTSLPTYFKSRRDRFMADYPEAALLIAGNHELTRNPDVHYPFRQESNFYYLTGFDEPDAFLVLTPVRAPAGRTHRMVMFVQPRNPEREMWEGERYGTEGAIEIFGADEAYPIGDLLVKLSELIPGVEEIFYRSNLPYQDEIDDQVWHSMEKARCALGRNGQPFPGISDPLHFLGEMRLFKSPEEIAILRRSGAISAEAHRQAMLQTKPGMNEFEVEALIDYGMRKGGCDRLGYGSIVAGGKNATCLHYRRNNAPLVDGDLLLIDAGGEFDYYTADITRTFPVGRRFSVEQAKLYDLTLKSQLAAVAMAKPGVTLPAIHRHVCEILTEGLLSLGLLKGKLKSAMESAAYREFYPHTTSHWLGMDVHDAGLYTLSGEPRKLEPGMVFTIEPGLYCQARDQAIPAAYRNIGIRIEDDVVVTATGVEVLTHGVPKARDEIEALRDQALL